MTPLNANAPLAKGRREKLSNATAYHVCSHKATVNEQMARGDTHHAREVCTDCGVFIRWVPKPETLERRRLNICRIAKLSMQGGLSDREREFVASVSKLKRWSPRQQACFDRLCATYLEAA